MIDKAREHAAAAGLANVAWHIGNVLPLPFPDRAFSIVVSRFAFHHFPDPLAVLREMARQHAPGPHTRALSLAELRGLFGAAGLPAPRETCYDVRGELEGLLATSFPAPGDIPVIRQMFADSLVDDALGMKTKRKDDKTLLSYPIAILAADV